MLCAVSSSTMSTSTTSSPIHVRVKYIAPAHPALPPLALQITALTGSYMVWIGTTEESEENVHLAASRGSLLRDWACAMPPSPNSNTSIPPAATSLFRASSSDVSLSMAQRLARRFKKQIFLSVDVSPSFVSVSEGSRVLLAVEKAVVEALKDAEERR